MVKSAVPKKYIGLEEAFDENQVKRMFSLAGKNIYDNQNLSADMVYKALNNTSPYSLPVVSAMRSANAVLKNEQNLIRTMEFHGPAFLVPKNTDSFVQQGRVNFLNHYFQSNQFATDIAGTKQILRSDVVSLYNMNRTLWDKAESPEKYLDAFTHQIVSFGTTRQARALLSDLIYEGKLNMNMVDEHLPSFVHKALFPDLDATIHSNVAHNLSYKINKLNPNHSYYYNKNLSDQLSERTYKDLGTNQEYLKDTEDYMLYKLLGSFQKEGLIDPDTNLVSYIQTVAPKARSEIFANIKRLSK